MLHLRPDLVKMEKAVDTKQNEALAGIRMNAHKLGSAEFGWDTIDLSPTGVFGAAGKTIEATKATAAHGEEMKKAHIEEVCALAEELKATKIEYLLPKPHK